MIAISILLNTYGCEKSKLQQKTGWTTDDYISWFYKSNPITDKTYGIYKDGKEVLLEEEKGLNCALSSMEDVKWFYPRYVWEWEIKLPPYNELPKPVQILIDELKQEDVGKKIIDIFPFVEDRLAICAMKNKKIVSKELLPIYLKKLSEDKLILTIRSSNFLLSINDETQGLCGDVVVLYLPEGSKPNICRHR